MVSLSNSDEHPSRPRAVWRILVPFGLVIALGIGLSALLTGREWGSRMGVGVGSDVLLALAVGAVLVVTARWLDHRRVSSYGFHLDRGWWADFAAGAVLGLILVATTFLVSYAQGWVTVVDVLSPGDAGSFAPWILLFGVGFLATGFWEESLFRGLLITNAAEGFGARGFGPRSRLLAALVLSTLGFGLIHGPLGTFPGDASRFGMIAVWTLTGGLLGIAYVFSGELAFPMGLHFTLNWAINNGFYGVAIAGLPTLPAFVRTEVTAPPLYHPLAGLPMIGVICLGYLLTLWWFATRMGGISLETDIGKWTPEPAD